MLLGYEICVLHGEKILMKSEKYSKVIVIGIIALFLLSGAI